MNAFASCTIFRESAEFSTWGKLLKDVAFYGEDFFVVDFASNSLLK